MSKKELPFASTLAAAVKLMPWLLNQDGEPNLSAVARYCKDKGHPVSQPTLQRHCFPDLEKPRALDDKVAKALSAVFHVPAHAWKGEPMSESEEKALSQFNYETILLAQKLERLPPRIREGLLLQIENAHSTQEELKRAMANGSITSIDRAKR